MQPSMEKPKRNIDVRGLLYATATPPGEIRTDHALALTLVTVIFKPPLHP
jgi:hypothetical protein